jgi:hypothetical protein
MIEIWLASIVGMVISCFSGNIQFGVWCSFVFWLNLVPVFFGAIQENGQSKARWP